MIQPHETHWDCPNIGFSTPTSSNTFSKPTNENQCVNLGLNELSECMEHTTKQLIEDLPETTLDNLNSNNPTMANSHENFVPSLRKPTWKAQFDDNLDHNTNFTASHGLSLITLLMECAVAISVDNLGEAHRMLLELTQMASPYGLSCAERVVAYFAKAMASRVMNSWLGICSPLVNLRSVNCAFQAFNNITPFIKFGHFTSNQAILEAFHLQDRVHIVDLDIMQGLQWPALFHILATRMEGPPHVRMTGISTSMELLVETGKQLSNFARRIGMLFEFHPIARKFGDMDSSMLPIRCGETLAVHWLQHSLYDATGPDWKTLRLLEQLEPRIITLVEQDVSVAGSFLDRFVGSLHYYSTMFDSIGAYLASDDSSRYHVEHSLFYREINNILAIGGPARSGEDKFRHWRSELGRNGRIVQVPLSANSMAQAQLILDMFPPVHGYNLVQGDGILRLGWKDTGLYTASAWTSHVYGPSRSLQCV